MKIFELKKQIKELHSLQEETEVVVNDVEDVKTIAKEVPNVKITVKEFKNFLKEEILETLNEQEEISDDNEEIDAETFDFDKPSFEPTGEQDIDDITDELVKLARKAKGMNQLELANQILNSAKYSSKTQFKDVEKEV